MSRPVTTPSALPFEGVRVLSLAEQYPGPYATLLLADLGADVILIERPNGGDPSRQFPSFFSALNRNKRSVVLDLKSEAGLRTLHRLAQKADLLLEGYRPGTAERLGFGYERLRESNSRLIYISVTGFGQDSPYRQRPAHDLSYLAAAGVMHDLVEENRTGPLSSLPIADLSSAVFTAFAAAAALFRRERCGSGSYVDVAMADGLVSWMTTQLVPVMNKWGPPGIEVEPGYGVFRAADDRLLSISVAHEDSFWSALCHAVGIAELAQLDRSERVARHDELRLRLEERIASRTRDQWVERMDEFNVPVAPVHSLEEVPRDRHVLERDLIVRVPAAERGSPDEWHVRQPLLFNGCRGEIRRPAPALGEHDREVLAEYGISADEL